LSTDYQQKSMRSLKADAATITIMEARPVGLQRNTIVAVISHFGISVKEKM